MVFVLVIFHNICKMLLKNLCSTDNRTDKSKHQEDKTEP